ncbi:hypothetical protein [Glaciecola sp. 1036]|uniref:hypothetical protein n=1 Tax=Alteromonadaceae TaxID=72275 RepID=UPI003CFFE7C7
MLTILLLISFVLSASYFYVEAVVHGMAKRKWLVGGIMLGPLLIPMFEISKHMTVRKAIGFNSKYLAA